jgi:uncharacterized membrane protein YsdA (DUF1294 family)
MNSVNFVDSDSKHKVLKAKFEVNCKISKLLTAIFLISSSKDLLSVSVDFRPSARY